MVVRRHESTEGSDLEIVAAAPPPTVTLSLALPASILCNAQTPELRMYLAGQVARAAAIFCVDELIIFHEQGDELQDAHVSNNTAVDLLATILEYLETPQYLRRFLFPVSSDLRLVGLLNPLALPSHVAKQDTPRWREGLAVGRRKGAATPPTRFVDVGQARLTEIDRPVPVGRRVTVDMGPSGADYDACPGKYLYGKLADRADPVAAGLYWGYRVRKAKSLADVLSGGPYDVVMGTSERGTPVEDVRLPKCEKVLVVFGGVHGLERSVEGDEALEGLGICLNEEEAKEKDDKHAIADLFDFYVNTCPQQGSRTIRTEEAILISLAALQPLLNQHLY